jgi:hypothetical protein
MKKPLIFLGLFLGHTLEVSGGTQKLLFCSIKHSKRVIPLASNHSLNDKNRHCTVSCMLALTCNDGEVLLAGVLKEFKDLFGPGNAERKDLVADGRGIHLVRTDRARTDSECLEQCDLIYPP